MANPARGRRGSLPIAIALGAAAGVGCPLVDLVLACRTPGSETCVWGEAYLPLTLCVSFVLVGGTVSALAYLVLRRIRGG